MYNDLQLELLNRQSIVNYHIMSFIKYISYFFIILMYDDLQIIHAEVATKPRQIRYCKSIKDYDEIS